MADLNALTAANARRWANAKPTRSFAAAARHLVTPEVKARYQAVSAKTGVPWPVIAVIHERECSQDWSGSLAQGDPWNRVSVHVPAGRGPFRSWEEAAVDALVNCPPHAARNKDWNFDAIVFAAGFAACWFSKDRITKLVVGSEAFAKSLEAKAAALKAAI